MKHLPMVALVLVAAVFLSALLLDDSGSDLLRFEVDGKVARGFGTTDSRSVGVVADLVDAHPQVQTLELVAMPGTRDVDMNRRIARRIREEGLDTRVPAGGVIASGAVDLFLAGVERDAECGARIGVHSWSAGTYRGPGYQPADDGVRDDQRPRQRKLLSELGIDPDFYEFTRDAARGEDIHWLTRDEMETWGVTSVARDCG